MEVKYLEMAGAAFDFAAPPISYKRCDTGLISHTFFIECEGDVPGYILQKINTEIFREPEKLMANIKGVCSHIAKKVEEAGGDPYRECRTVISTKSGEDYFIDPDGCYWRAFLEIPDVISYDYPDSPELFYKSALAFGKFSRQLSDFPAHTLYETIPNFHNSVSRMEQFKAAVAADKMGRARECGEEIEFALSKAPLCSFITDGLRDGRFKLCVTHNDTKINNVLMDKDSGEGICVIDLDIVMPGSILYDFGDAIRFGASTALEDEKDLEKVSLDLEMFDVFVNGFVGELRDSMTDDEVLALPMGAYLMTLETGIRFLGDYLNGDVYYHTKYPGHNLDRARNQLRLLQDMDEKMEEMQAVVAKYL